MTYDYNDNVNDNSNGNQAGERRTCIDCGLPWIYTDEERRFIEVEKASASHPVDAVNAGHLNARHVRSRRAGGADADLWI